MISTQNIEQAKKQIKSEKKPIIVQAQNYDFNRKMLEYGKFDILLSPEAKTGRDTIKKIDSGLDYITSGTAAKNKIAIGIDLNELRNLEKKEKAQRLKKIIQNIKLCRKAKAKIALLNCKDSKDAMAFLISLGASTSQAKEALSF